MGKYMVLLVVEAVTPGLRKREMSRRGKKGSQMQHLTLARDVSQPFLTMVTLPPLFTGGASSSNERE